MAHIRSKYFNEEYKIGELQEVDKKTIEKLVKKGHLVMRCKKCEDVVYSANRHDFTYCFCHSIAVDGWNDYGRLVWNFENMEVYDTKISGFKQFEIRTSIWDMTSNNE